MATEAACTRIARYAFRTPTRRGRKKVTVFHKANIMKLTDGMFLNCARRVHEEEYPEHRLRGGDHRRRLHEARAGPDASFDVLLMENLYGDLVSDLCAGLVGGLGVVPGSNIGDDAAVFEAVHGSAPDIAGKGVANPLALIMSGVMMLNHIGEEDIADKIKRPTTPCSPKASARTRDLGGTAAPTSSPTRSSPSWTRRVDDRPDRFSQRGLR